MAPLKPLDFIMALRSLPAGNALLTASVVLAFCLITASGHTQGASPFAKLEGQWAGSGTIDLANGAYEPIKCRASYDVLEEQNNLQLSIRCASDSYNFDMHASATLASKAISGSWNEVTRNVAGKISGTAEGDHIDVVADGAAFSADLAMVTRGDRQSVVIKSKEVNATVKGATVTLQRS
jgi:hypothetical protein